MDGREPVAERQAHCEQPGLRLGDYVEVREAIELELDNVYEGRKSVDEGLDAAVRRGNAIVREFSITHGAAHQGEI